MPKKNKFSGYGRSRYFSLFIQPSIKEDKDSMFAYAVDLETVNEICTTDEGWQLSLAGEEKCTTVPHEYGKLVFDAWTEYHQSKII